MKRRPFIRVKIAAINNMIDDFDYADAKVYNEESRKYHAECDELGIAWEERNFFTESRLVDKDGVDVVEYFPRIKPESIEEDAHRRYIENV